MKTRHVSSAEQSVVGHVLGTIEPIISRETFDAAQAIIVKRRGIKRTDESLLERLRYLLQTHGHLNRSVINADDGGPPLWVYEKHFGKLSRAYARIGYDSPHDKTEREESNERKRAMFRNLASALREKGLRCIWNSHRRQLLIEDFLSLGILIGKYKPTPFYRSHRWVVHTRRESVTDLTIVMRLGFDKQNVLDYLLLPKTMIQSTLMNLTENLRPELRAYRFVTYGRLVAGLLLQLALHRDSKGISEVVG